MRAKTLRLFLALLVSSALALGLMLSEGLLHDLAVIIKSAPPTCTYRYEGDLSLIFSKGTPETINVGVEGIVSTVNCSFTITNVSIERAVEGLSNNHAGIVGGLVESLINNLSLSLHEAATRKQVVSLGSAGGYRVGSGPTYTCVNYAYRVAKGVVRGCLLRIRGCGLLVPAQLSGIIGLRSIPKSLGGLLNIYMVSLKPQGCFAPNTAFYSALIVINALVTMVAGVATYLLLRRVVRGG